MEKDMFAQHFRQAHRVALEFTRQYVLQKLPDEVRFRLHPNQSYDGNPLIGDEEVYPEDGLKADEYFGPLTEEQVIDWLWRDGKVPERVNLSVEAEDESFTHIELLCCGRYTAMTEHLYHQHEGYPPFHVLGPPLPIGWKSIEKSGPFDLYWHK